MVVAPREGADVEAGDGSGQETDGCEDTEAAADVVGDGEDVVRRVMLGIQEVAELALGAGNGGEHQRQDVVAGAVNLLISPFTAEGCGRFDRAARLADHHCAPALLREVGIDAGVLQEFEQFLERVVIDVVALEVHPRLAHAEVRWHLVVVGVAEGVEKRFAPDSCRRCRAR